MEGQGRPDDDQNVADGLQSIAVSEEITLSKPNVIGCIQAISIDKPWPDM